MSVGAPRADVYTDFQGFTELRREAQKDNPQALRAAAQQFESLFTQMMLKSMRQASMGDPIFDSQEGGFYRDMFDAQLSLSLSKGKGLGLADMLVQQLGGMRNGVKEPAVSISTGVSPSALPVRVSAMTATGAVSPLAAEVSDAPQAFVARIWPYAQRAGAELGVDPRAIVAQSALETGWGQGIMRKPDGNSSHNLFGIKADAHWQGDRATSHTVEYDGGIRERKTASFRAYASDEAAFRDYVEFVRGNPRYREALTQGSDANGYIRALAQAGYATDPAYADKISSILNGDTLGGALASLKA